MSKYWGLYRVVLVTNTRDFVLLGEDAAGQPVKLETFRLADSAEDFDQLLQKPKRLRTRRRGRSGRVPLPRPLPHRLAHRAEGPRLAARILCPRRPRTRRGQRRRAVVDDRPLGAGRGPRRQIRGRPRRRILPFDAGPNTLLRRLLRMGVVGPTNTRAHRPVQLARGGLASARPGAAGAVSAALRPRPSATAGPRRGARLDLRGPGPRRPRRLLRPLQRGRGRPVLLRAIPRSFRPRPPQAAWRLVHANRGRPLHGRTRRQGVKGRSRHRRRAGGRKRLRAGSMLRNGRISRRDAAPHRNKPGRPRTGRAHRRTGQAGGH